jgi:hypothetical protein
MRTNVNIMRNLYLIIEPDTFFKHRVVQRTAINRRVGANLDIVADPDTTELGYIQPAPVLVGQTETVTADYRPGCYVNALANSDLVTNNHIRGQPAVSADDTACTDKTASGQLRTGMHNRTFFNNAVRPDPGCRIHAAVGIHHSRRMHTLAGAGSRHYQGCRTCVTCIGI